MVFGLFGKRPASAFGKTPMAPPAPPPAESFRGFGMRAGESGPSVPLKSASVTIQFSGVLVHTRITQKYRNDGRKPIEAVYAFPLPSQGILLSMDVRIGNRTLKGVVKASQSAARDYEAAIGSGNSAFLLRNLANNIFQMNLGNLLGREEAEVTIHYAELLQWNAGELRYRLPTVIAPHYGNPARIGLAAEDALSTDLAAEYPLTLSVRIEGSLSNAVVNSPTHRIVARSDSRGVLVALGENAALDRDFVLAFRLAKPAPLEIWRASDGDQTTVLATLVAPAIERTNLDAPADVIALVDCSGSMAGDAISQVVEALVAIIKQLPAGSHLAVVRFGSTVDFMHGREVEISHGNRDALIREVRQIKADLGGTEIVAALSAVIRKLARRPDILLITDGEAHVSDPEIDAIASSGHRIFTVGVGSAVSEHLVRSLAEKSGAACELVTPNEQMADRIVAHCLRMQGAKTGVQMGFDGREMKCVASRPAVFAGDTVIYTAQLPRPVANGEVFLRQGDSEVLLRAPVRVAEGEFAAFLPRIAAWLRLRSLDREAATEMAVRYQLVTSTTSMIAVLERAADERPSELPEFRESPQMLAAGYGGSGSVLASTRFGNVGASPRMMGAACPAFPDDDGMDCDFTGLQVCMEVDPMFAVIEEAAIAYADNHADEALSALTEGIRDPDTSETAERIWLMLFDLYQVRGDRQAFEDLEPLYVSRFAKPAPNWRETQSQNRGSDDAFYLDGEILCGRLDELRGWIQNRDQVVVDLGGVTRMDFTSAEVLCNVLCPHWHRGAKIVLRNPNRLVAELLLSIGVVDLATIVYEEM